MGASHEVDNSIYILAIVNYLREGIRVVGDWRLLYSMALDGDGIELRLHDGGRDVRLNEWAGDTCGYMTCSAVVAIGCNRFAEIISLDSSGIRVTVTDVAGCSHSAYSAFPPKLVWMEWMRRILMKSLHRFFASSLLAAFFFFGVSSALGQASVNAQVGGSVLLNPTATPVFALAFGPSGADWDRDHRRGCGDHDRRRGELQSGSRGGHVFRVPGSSFSMWPRGCHF